MKCDSIVTPKNVGNRDKKNAEWQTSREQLSFQSREIGGRIFAEAELLPATFLPLLQLRTQVAPLETVPGSEILSREDLLLAGDSRNDAHRATDHHPRNSSTSARRAPLMNACHPEALF